MDSMVFIKGGSFFMGSDAGDDDEKPVHEVILSDFYITKHEVTAKEYQTCIDIKGCKNQNVEDMTSDFRPVYKKYNTLHKPEKENHPINFVNWKSAKQYIIWLNLFSALDYDYRLCTEAEWEYAARGGKSSIYYCGNSDLCLNDIVWYRENSDFQAKEIMTKQANDLGLYDMYGNVWEWVEDAYHADYYSSFTDATSDPVDSTGDLVNSDYDKKVLRGCSFFSHSEYCRLTKRHNNNKEYFASTYGFRVCSSVPE
jgi:formylglycine-generating enzyme